MDPDSILQIIILTGLLSFSAFFSASETALMSLNKIRLRHMVEEKVKGAELVERLLKNPAKLLGTILVGNNVVNIGASALATSLAIEFFGSVGVGIATGIMTLLVLIFGEITPKSFAASNAEKISLKVAKILTILSKVLTPIIIILTYVTNLIIIALGGKINRKQPFITEAELKTMVDVGHEEGVLEVEERKMIYNVFQFGDSQVKDAMITRTDIAAIDIQSSYDEILDMFIKEQYSRLPVYRNTIDNIVGVLYIKDIFFYDKRKEKYDIERLVRKPYYTYETKRIAELFEDMRKQRIQIAVVVDEYGGTAGIVTMEDLVEEIFGDIRDEYDEVTNYIQKKAEGEYIVDGLTRLGLINETLGTTLVSQHYETIGGYITGIIGRFPDKDETIEFEGLKFTVLDVDRSRIKRLKLEIILKTKTEAKE